MYQLPKVHIHTFRKRWKFIWGCFCRVGSRASVPYVVTCLRAFMLLLLTCFANLHFFSALRAFIFLRALRAFIFYAPSFLYVFPIFDVPYVRSLCYKLWNIP